MHALYKHAFFGWTALGNDLKNLAIHVADATA
jgi:hypothetical protein